MSLYGLEAMCLIVFIPLLYILIAQRLPRGAEAASAAAGTRPDAHSEVPGAGARLLGAQGIVRGEVRGGQTHASEERG